MYVHAHYVCLTDELGVGAFPLFLYSLPLDYGVLNKRDIPESPQRKEQHAGIIDSGVCRSQYRAGRVSTCVRT